MPTPKTKRCKTDRRTIRLGGVLDDALKAVDEGKERNLSVLMRKAARMYLDPKQQKLDPRPLCEAIRALRVDLARTGSNLNQLAHGFNSVGQPGFARDPLAVQHEELRKEHGKIMRKLRELETVMTFMYPER